MNRWYHNRWYHTHRYVLLCTWVQLASLEHQVCARSIESFHRQQRQSYLTAPQHSNNSCAMEPLN